SIPVKTDIELAGTIAPYHVTCFGINKELHLSIGSDIQVKIKLERRSCRCRGSVFKVLFLRHHCGVVINESDEGRFRNRHAGIERYEEACPASCFCRDIK